MRKDSVVFGVAGIFFGFLVGWIIGSQQATGVATPAPASAPQAQAAPATQAPPPFDESAAAALKVTADRNPSDAETRVQLGNMYFDGERYPEAVTWYEAALKVNPKHVNASTDLGHRVLLLEPAGSRARAVRSIAGHRSQALEDAAEPGDRARVRQAGSRGGGEGVAAGARRRARQPGGGARQARARRAPRRAPHGDREAAGRKATRRVGVTHGQDDPVGYSDPARRAGRVTAHARGPRRRRVSARDVRGRRGCRSCAIPCAASTSCPARR